MTEKIMDMIMRHDKDIIINNNNNNNISDNNYINNNDIDSSITNISSV